MSCKCSQVFWVPGPRDRETPGGRGPWSPISRMEQRLGEGWPAGPCPIWGRVAYTSQEPTGGLETCLCALVQGSCRSP